MHQQAKGGQLFLDTQQNLCDSTGATNEEHDGFKTHKRARENPERGFLGFVSFMHHWNQEIYQYGSLEMV